MKKKNIIKIIICVISSILCGCDISFSGNGNATPTAAATPQPFSTPTPQPPRYTEYSAVLDVDPETLTVKGVEKIKYINTTEAPLSNIFINTHLNAFSEQSDYRPYFDIFKPKIFKLGQSFGGINIINVSVNNYDVSFTHENTILGFNLDSPISPDNSIEIAINFEAKIPKINHRTGANDRAMWFGNFLPTLAVYDENGWQIDKYYAAGYPFYTRIANFNVVINTPAEYTVAGTGQKSSVLAENKKSTTLVARLTRDFAFAVSRNFSEVTLVTDSGVEITLYYYSELQNARDYLQIAADSLSYYDKTIGSYPYPSLDIIECGLFFNSGMKYPQVIFMDSDHLRESGAAATIVQQTGHQWFYNVIGSSGVKDAWISEGLTMLAADCFFYGDEELDRKIREEYQLLKMKLMSVDDLAVRQNPEGFDSWSDYYNIVCMKSKMMLYSLKLKMGPKFGDFLKLYYSTYSFRLVNSERFIRVAEEVYENELGPFFESWLGNYEMPELEGFN